MSRPDQEDDSRGAARKGRPSPDDLAAGQREFTTLMSAQVRDVYLRKPHFLDAGTDLVTTSRELARQEISDALVRDGARLGIFTTTRLRDALLEPRPPSALTVGEFTAYDLRAVRTDDALYDAMSMMLRHRIHRVLVRDGDEIVGILSQLDLMGFLANHSHLIMAKVDQAPDIEALREPAAQVEALIRGLSADGVRIEIISGITGRLNRQIFRRLWEMVAPEALRANSCLIVMGSEGRSEQVIRTDQDNGLILRDGFTHPEIESATAAFTEALISFGYPPCPGGIMVSQPLWRQPLAGVRDSLRDWVYGDDPDGPMNLAIFLDAAPVAGDVDLLAEARAYLRRIIGDSAVFYARFASAIEQFSAGEGGWWRRLTGLRAAEPAQIDLKKQGLFPIVHGVRTLALQYGIDALPSDDRLTVLSRAGRIDSRLAHDLTVALHQLMELKLQANLAQIEAGEAPGNLLRWDSLGTLERQSLKDTLGIVRDFRQWIAQHYRLDQL